MRILIACASFDPKYGGPAFSVSCLARELAVQGHQVGLWAPDGSALSSSLVIPTQGLACFAGGAGEAVESFGPIGCLHDNGIWLPHNHQLAKIARQRSIIRVVSTRGMLEPWALKHKRWKKRVAWLFYQSRDLVSADRLHATAESEAYSVRRLIPSVTVEVIPNGIEMPVYSPTPVCSAGKSKIALFLGRIYPVKGLPMLVEGWAAIRPNGWVLHIAGPDEGGHREEIERLVAANGLSEVISFLGPVDAKRKADVYARADLFVLPSHSESFGMAIGEALSHGLPVLTTKAAPWSMLPASKCGWWVDTSVEGIAEALREITTLDRPTLRAMGARGRALVAGEFDWTTVAKRMSLLYAAAGAQQ